MPSKADLAYVHAIDVATKAFKRLFLAGYKDAEIAGARVRLHHTHKWYSPMSGETPVRYANRIVRSSHDGNYRKPKEK